MLFRSEEDKTIPNKGYPISTLSLLLCKSKKINENLLKKYSTGDAELPSVNAEQAENIIETALEAGFTHTFISSRFFVEYLIDEEIKLKSMDKVLNKIQQIKDPIEIMDACKTISQFREVIDKQTEDNNNDNDNDNND